MKIKNFLIKYNPEDGVHDYRYDTVPAGTAQAAYNKWYKELGGDKKKFICVENYDGVVFNIHTKG